MTTFTLHTDKSELTPLVGDELIPIEDTNDTYTVKYITPNSITVLGGATFLMQDGTTPLTANWNIGGYNINNTGNIGIGIASPLAALHLKAGTATANTAPVKFTAGPLLTTPEAGTIEYYNDRFYVTNVAIQRVLDRTSGIIVATTTVNSSDTADVLWTEPLAIGSLKAGNTIKVKVAGLINNTATADVTLSCLIGTLELFSFAPSLGNLSAGTAYHWELDFEVTIRTAGSSGTLAVHSHVDINGTTESALVLHSVDTTAANALVVKAQWQTADALNIITAEISHVEFKG